MNIPTASTIIQELHNQVCTVVFEKKDGTHRTMNCTLNKILIESKDLVPTGGGHNVSTDQIRVVDVDINQWRSFNYSNIVSFKTE
jgi:hypothetical protein